MRTASERRLPSGRSQSSERHVRQRSRPSSASWPEHALLLLLRKSAQQREKDNSDDLRKRISALSDEVCELHAECDALRTQLDSRQVLLCDQRVENVALEKFMNVQKQNSIETQVPFAAPSSIAPPVPVATIQSTVTAPLGAESNTIANVAASENGQDATEGVVARTSRSRRGGRGKGGKGKTMNAVDMPGVKENAAGNANMFGMSVINGMDFRSMSCSTTARVGASAAA